MQFVGNPTTPAAKCKAMAKGGPLLIAPDHVLSVMLPDALDRTTHAPHVVINMIDVQSALIGGTVFEPSVLESGVHFAVETARWQQLLKDINDAGFAYEPVTGEMANAWPEVSLRLVEAAKNLPLDKRLIKAADVLFDGSKDDAATGTWYDWMSPSMLVSGEGGPEVLAQFQALLPNAMYSGHEFGRAGDSFKATLEQIECSVGRDISSLDNRAKAAAVAAWSKRTRPPKLLIAWVGNPMEEVERRAQPTVAGRFEPLFNMGWHRIVELRKLWPEEMDDPVDTAGALASGLGVAGLENGLTPQAISALLTALRNYASFAASPTNAGRSADVLRAYRSATAADKTGETLTIDAKAQLQADTGFQKLKTKVEGIGIDDHSAIVTAMLESDHGAGLLFLNGRMNHDKFWKERAGARTEASIQTVFNNAVSYTTAGEAADWGAILPEGVGKRLVAGDFAVNWWDMLKSVVAKRAGKHVAEKITARLRGKPPKAVFSDEEAMRMMEKSARACMDLLMPGRDAHSFAAVWQQLTQMASSIHNLPASCDPAIGLRARLEDAAMQAMRCPQDRFKAMLATPANAVRRVTAFTIDGQALNAINAVKDNLKRIMQEVDDGMHGYAKDQKNNRVREAEWQQWEEPKRPKLMEQLVWGSAAVSLGITSNADGTKICFGTRLHVFEQAPDLKANCVACFVDGKQRDKWCPTPNKCWKQGGEHAHAAIESGQCRAVDANTATDFSWDEMTVTIAEASKQQPYGGRGRGDGKGKGAGAPGGKGKGGGRGKGKGGGKGAGKGKGKGGPHFARQSRQ